MYNQSAHGPVREGNEMTRYYAIVLPPRFPLRKPLNIFRVSERGGRTIGERMDKKRGEWVKDARVLLDLSGIGGTSRARPISVEQAREILDGLESVKDADRLLWEPVYAG